MDAKTNTLLGFNKQLHDLVDKQLKLDILPKDNLDFFASFAVAKAFKTYEAVGTLCHAGYGEDAFMLARTLLELMVATCYILRDKTEERLLRYMNYDWVTRKKMFDYLKSKPELVAELEKAIHSGTHQDARTEIEEEFKKVKEKYKYGNSWSDKTMEDMLEEIGRADLYPTVYSMQCTLGHTSARSINDYVTLTDEGVVFNTGANWDLVKTTLVVIFDCFFQIAMESAAKFEWGIESQLEEMSQQWKQEVWEIKPGL